MSHIWKRVRWPAAAGVPRMNPSQTKSNSSTWRSYILSGHCTTTKDIIQYISHLEFADCIVITVAHIINSIEIWFWHPTMATISHSKIFLHLVIPPEQRQIPCKIKNKLVIEKAQNKLAWTSCLIQAKIFNMIFYRITFNRNTEHEDM